jgi:hypothetical protein
MSEHYVTPPTASPSITTLPMTDEEKAAAAERDRQREPFGFARAIVEDPGE